MSRASAGSRANAGGSFIEQGQQQVNVREVGLYRNVNDIENTVLKTQSGTALRVKDIATVVQGPKIRLGQIGKACRFGALPQEKPVSSWGKNDPCINHTEQEGSTKEGSTKVIQREDGKIIDDPDVVEGIVLLQKGDDSEFALKGIHKKVDELNRRV
jgi:cobalt-zinc-cadmium resistance protein CzcA